MPASILQYSTDWVAHAGKSWSHGTVSISGGVFLREKLLPILSEVNAATTIVPNFSGIERDKWKLELKSWAEHPKHKPRDCPWTLVPGSGSDGSLRYQWKHHDRYNYEHQGGSYITNGVYSVFSTSFSLTVQ